MFHYYCLIIYLILLFLYGFFPIPTDPKNHQNELPTIINNFEVLNVTYPRHFQKMILVVIDALRTDFVTLELMPFTSKMVQSNNGCLSNIKVESPTVTLPRIKAMTSGHIPQYVDLIKNLAASEVSSDSWLHSAKEVGLKMVFYGDENWLPLFPNFFARYEGTSSFYVRDFTEVDDNVTRNVNLELEKNDWNIMILHYLGLDHIGHVHGPFSDKIPAKLLEMDNIIEQIYTKTAVDEKTMILVTGDHGMHDNGGHGGTTDPEINVPFAALGLTCRNSSFLQTDIPANLAVSMGIKIPATSIGRIDRSFLNFLTEDQYLYALHYNTEILLNLKNSCEDEFEKAARHYEKYLETLDKNHRESAIKLYLNCSKIICDDLLKTTHQHHTFLLVLSIFSMANVVAILFVSMLTAKKSNMILEFFAISLVNLTNLFVKMDKTILYGSLLVLVVLFIKNIVRCYTRLKTAPMPNFLNLFLLVMSGLHSFTFFSTSFIEEEHLFWYYFGTTHFLFLIIKHFSKKIVSVSKVCCLILTIFFLRFIREFNSLETSGNIVNNLIKEENLVSRVVIPCLGLAITFFILARSKEIGVKQTCFYFVILLMIFLLKIESQYSILLGKVVWLLILLEFLLISKLILTKNISILVGSLLLKPQNVILIPLAVFISKVCLSPRKSPLNLSIRAYLFSNYFYFAQGHRNNLATVDISAGYIGLGEYNAVIVIAQNVIHIFIFMILFNLLALETMDASAKSTYWLGLLSLKSCVILLTFIDLFANRYHLFIWSVFAPKLFIESVHTLFLFVQVTAWYCYTVLRRLYFSNCYKSILLKNNKRD